MRPVFAGITIVFALCFAAVAAMFVAGVLQHLSSGWSPAGRWTAGVLIGAATQAGLVITAFQRTPSAGMRVTLLVLMLPSLSVFYTIVRTANLSQQEQVVVMIAAAMGLLVYAVAIGYVLTRRFRETA